MMHNQFQIPPTSSDLLIAIHPKLDQIPKFPPIRQPQFTNTETNNNPPPNQSTNANHYQIKQPKIQKKRKKKKMDCTDLMEWQPWAKKTSKKSQKMRKIPSDWAATDPRWSNSELGWGKGIDWGRGGSRLAGIGVRSSGERRWELQLINPHFGICSVCFFLFFNLVGKRNLEEINDFRV